jgi:hypothetical protein
MDSSYFSLSINNQADNHPIGVCYHELIVPSNGLPAPMESKTWRGTLRILTCPPFGGSQYSY